MNRATIIIGVGNPVLTDDSVGLKIAGELRAQLTGQSLVRTAEVHSGGMKLMETMVGYDRAIVIDAIVSGRRPGTIFTLGAADLPKTRNAHSTHDASLPVALELGRLAGLHVPSEIRIWAVEADDVVTVSEGLTPAVKRAVPRVVKRVMKDLREHGLGCSRRRNQ
jgi:hydrogenase maturation protease